MSLPSLLPSLLKTYQARTEKTLEHWLPSANINPSQLHEAMRYTSLDGGKRVRPVLVYLTGQMLGASPAALDGPACALELIHVYSLIHDDLPAMDDDELRRGKPTCHIQFDEATAILTGDALQSLAFYILAHDPKMVSDASQRLKMVETLALASGSRGMAGGQAIDLAAVGNAMSLVELENMHIHKTGALIRASVKLGALSLPDANAAQLEKLDHFANCMGLAFQIRDDILDIESDTETLGKPQGSDQARNKPTYPALLGMSEAKRRADELHQEAIDSVADWGEAAQPLRDIAEYIIHRKS
ncbi:MAG: (2E,6E)-farnesyl diphosphate synthase [Ectothiorhodospiraceae bacterium]|nr:(2E,6E)-farnesyl diphosphate synthase [Ectothiorhodospiraceae bacterium]